MVSLEGVNPIVTSGQYPGFAPAEEDCRYRCSINMPASDAGTPSFASTLLILPKSGGPHLPQVPAHGRQIVVIEQHQTPQILRLVYHPNGVYPVGCEALMEH